MATKREGGQNKQGGGEMGDGISKKLLILVMHDKIDMNV